MALNLRQNNSTNLKFNKTTNQDINSLLELGKKRLEEERLKNQKQQEEAKKQTKKDITTVKNNATTEKKTALQKYEDYLSSQSNSKFGSANTTGGDVTISGIKPTVDTLQTNQSYKYQPNSLNNTLQNEATNRNALLKAQNTKEAKELKEEALTARDKESRANFELQNIQAQEDYEENSKKWYGKAKNVATQPFRAISSMFDHSSNTVRNENGESYNLGGYSDIYTSIAQKNAGGVEKLALGAVNELSKQGMVKALNYITGLGGTVQYYADIMDDQYNDAMARGYSADKATSYAIVDGLIQASLEYALGGDKTIRQQGESLLSKGISKVATKFTKSKIVNKLISHAGADFIEEFLEEYVGKIDEKVILDGGKGLGKELTSSELFQDALYSGMVGALVSGTEVSLETVGKGKNERVVDQAIYDIERSNNGKLSKKNKAILDSIAENYSKYSKDIFGEEKQPTKEIVANIFSELKENQINKFNTQLNERIPMNPNEEIKTNELKNNVDDLIFDTGFNVKIDNELQSGTVEQEGNTITINPFNENGTINDNVIQELDKFTNKEDVNISESQNENKIQGLENYSKQEIKDITTDYVKEQLLDNGIDATINGIEIIGSRNRGTANENSDLDVVIEFDGENLREDSLFDILNDIENKLNIDGIDVDINPILKDKSGTIEEFMKKSNEYDKEVISRKNNNNKTNTQEEVKQVSKAPQIKSDKQTNSDNTLTKERQTYKSIIDSENTSEEAKKVSKKLLDTDTYIPDSNQKQLKRADQFINNDPDGAYSSVKHNIENGKIDSTNIATLERLIEYYSKTGNEQMLEDVIQTTALAGTISGRNLQAMSLLYKQTPQGKVNYIEKVVNKMNQDIKKGEKYNFTQEMKDRILSANKENIDTVMDEVMVELGQQRTMSNVERLNAWRYFSMLSSPTTHIRNTLGNVLMYGTKRTKDKLAGAIERVFLPQEQRTKTVGKADKKYVDFANKDYNIKTVQDRLGVNDNKYNPTSKIKQNNKTFNHDILEKTIGKAMDFNTNMLNKEDVKGFFGIGGLEKSYKTALADYLQAQNIDLNKINDKQLQMARNYAIAQAQEATFHQDSALASAIQTLEDKNKLTKLVVGATVPFKKTPVNVAKTGLEYSPAGLLKSLTVDTSRLKSGDITASQYIDNISKGLTGTGIALLGFALADAGLVRSSGGDDKDDYYDQDKGFQNFSITVGGKSYSLDWVSPVGIPFFIGSELYNISKDISNEDGTKKENNASIMSNALRYVDAMSGALNPLTEMTMLQGITDVLSSYSNSKGDMLEQLFLNMSKTYANQFMPSLYGRIAKSTDEYERTTTSTKKGSVEKTLDTIKKNYMSKSIIGRRFLEVKTDAWGNEIKQNSNPLLRTAYNLGSPATVKDIRQTDVDKEIERLYEKTGESGVLPKTYLDKKIKLGDKEYQLSDKEYAKYKNTIGKTNYDAINTVIKSDTYKSLNDKEKADVISNIYNYDKEMYRVLFADEKKEKYEVSNKYKTAYKIEQDGGNVANYFVFRSQITDDAKRKDEYELLANMDISNNDKQIFYKNSYATNESTKVFFNGLEQLDIDMDEYLDYLSQDFQSDKNSDGETISGSKKKKVYEYVNNSDLTYEQRLMILGHQYALSSSEKATLIYTIMDMNISDDEKDELYGKIKGVKVIGDRIYW